MRELNGLSLAQLTPELLCSHEPLVMRGLVSGWPVVQTADPLAYLRDHDAGTAVNAWIGPPEIEGRFHYNDDLSGFNFSRQQLPLAAVLEALARHRDDAQPPAIYFGATAIDSALPRFRAQNDLPPAIVEAWGPLASLWLGNRSRISAHQDLPDNLACVVAGRRRFTLFPPDQVRNLYIGPLEHTPAGQPVSLVDFKRPDLQRFPKFALAMEQAQVAELAPGDAIFIPSLWWHHVEALAPVNALVNYWWRRTPMHMDSPMGALLHTLMTVRDLPREQRDAWRTLFDHYVFEAGDETAAHIPPAARDLLAPLDDTATRALRARLIRRLNR